MRKNSQNLNRFLTRTIYSALMKRGERAMQTGKPRRFMNACLHCLVLLGPALLLSCTDPQAENGLAIKGSTTVLPIVQVAAEVYMDGIPKPSSRCRAGVRAWASPP